MARRRRRGSFSRIRPDMGWWVDQGQMGFAWQGDPEGGDLSFGTAESLIQFQDITDDDSLILRDNSDWFIKRVIFEGWLNYFPGDTDRDVDDYWKVSTVSIGTIDNDKLAEWVVNQSHTLFEPGGYEMWARMLRTYNKPAYYPGNPRIQVNNPNTGAFLTTPAQTPVDLIYGAAAPFMGHSAIYDDFTVSNAGLRPEQSFSIGLSALNPGGEQMLSGDAINLYYAVRVLLQKRRAA